MPVSISLGLWSTLIMYGLDSAGDRQGHAPRQQVRRLDQLGDHRRLRHSGVSVRHSADRAVRRRQLLELVPLRGLTSANFDDLTLGGKIIDYFWHLALPVTATVIGNFATLTLLTKNSFLDEINKQYVITARAKGLSKNRVLYGHVFRNAMLIIIAGFPAAFIGMFFTGSLLIEVIFSLDGLGLLSFEAAINRDYPVVFGTLFLFTLLGTVVKLIGDLTYTLVDPRIDFESREA